MKGAKFNYFGKVLLKTPGGLTYFIQRRYHYLPMVKGKIRAIKCSTIGTGSSSKGGRRWNGLNGSRKCAARQSSCTT
jgi:hypothetical protein